MKNLKQIPDNLIFYRHSGLRVGFSGGADSTALLLLLLEWNFAPEQLECVHFDHGLRGQESCGDAKWCRDFCKKLGIKLTIVELKLLENKRNGSLEDIARNARLQWYKANDNGLPVVLAHHAGDVCETLLLKLARGGNATALSSLRPVRKLGNLTLLRPLLDFRKSELEAFLRQKNVHNWRIDSSNAAVDYHRNYLRNKLLCEWQNYHAPVIDGLQRSFECLSCDADFIESMARQILAELGEKLPRKTAVAFWKSLHPALMARVLPGYIREFAGSGELFLTHAMLKRFNDALRLAESSEKRLIELGNNCTFILKNNELEIVDQALETAENSAVSWQWQSRNSAVFSKWMLTAEVLEGAHELRGDGVFCFDAALMPEILLLQPRRGGELMQVWGSSEMRRVKHLLSGCRKKDDIFLLCKPDGEIILLGNWRRGVIAPVTADTVKTLKISVKYLD